MKKLKILIVGNYLPDKQISMQRFTDLLVESLRPHGHEIKVIYPTIVVNRFKASFEEKGKWWGYIDKLLIFPFYLRKEARWADIVHITDHSNAYYVRSIQNKPHIVTCHDVIAVRSSQDPKDRTIKRSGKILQNIILRGLKKAENFACVSANTKKELLEIVRSSPNKAVVIYNSLNYPFRKIPKEQARQILSPLFQNESGANHVSSHFVLHVGANQHYKNRMGVLRIYHQLLSRNHKVSLPGLIMAGRPLSDEMKEFIKANDLECKVVEIINCSDEQIQALYSLAQVFIFPSLAEGFGWPVIEAQACGCRVLTSNFAPLTEIGGDAALYCDPRDEAAFALQLDGLLKEPEAQRNARIQSGLENVKRFTPHTMIEGYLSLYQTVIETHASNQQ